MKKSLTVMSYNVCWGASKPGRSAGVLATIARVSPDVVVLQECVGWDRGPQLAEIAAALGVAATPQHAFLAEGTLRRVEKLHISAVSRLPIRGARRHAGDEIAHCELDLLLDWDGAPLRILGAHLTASSADLRMREIRNLAACVVPPAELADGHVLLAGDLNSLSPRDPYYAAFLARPGTGKFGSRVAFPEIELLEDQGWVDTLHHRGRPAAWVQ